VSDNVEKRFEPDTYTKRGYRCVCSSLLTGEW